MGFYMFFLLFLSKICRFFPRFFSIFPCFSPQTNGHLSESSWSILGGFGGCGSVEEKAALMATVKRLKVILDNSATKDRDQVGSKLFTRKMDGVMPEKSHFQGELVLAP